MKRIVEEAYAKVNLGLDVLSRRPDGYHEVRMIMQTIDLHDTVTLETRAEGGITIESGSSQLPNDSSNLAYRAAAMLMNEFDIHEGLHINIDKRIPIAAGMAGGSTDAAAVLRGVNDLFGLGLSIEELQHRGASLGADVPFCILGGCNLSEGIGEILTPLKGMPDYPMLIAKPPISVSTKWVYESLDLSEVIHPDIDAQLSALESGDIDALCVNMGNVLESVTITKYDVITQIADIMRESGAIGAMMSGSGPTVFGIFSDENAQHLAYDEMIKSGLAKDVILTRPHNI